MEVKAIRTDDEFMRLAIEQAGLARSAAGRRRGRVSGGAGRRGVWQPGTKKASCGTIQTAHAEMVTLRRVGERLRGIHFSGCALYCTLQPCGMCMLACVWAKVARIVYGAGRGDVDNMYFEERHLNTMDFIRDAFRSDIEVVGGVLREECAAFYVRRSSSVCGLSGTASVRDRR